MRVNSRREGYQTMEERCLRKAMSKLIVERQRNMEIGKGRRKKCGDLNGEDQSVEIQKGAKKKKRKGRKECFESGMKMLLRIGEDSDQGGESI